MENIDKILETMELGIKKDNEDHKYRAFLYIKDIMDNKEFNIDDKLEIIKYVEVLEIKELLYIHLISTLSKELFYEKTK